MQFRDPSKKARFNKIEVVEPIVPRDALYGGRVETFQMHRQFKEGEKGSYVDFVSLYPFVNKYRRYPVGQPQVITKDFGDMRTYFGITKVKILAPRALYIPGKEQ